MGTKYCSVVKGGFYALRGEILEKEIRIIGAGNYKESSMLQ